MACLSLSEGTAFETLFDYCTPPILPLYQSTHRHFCVYDVDYYPHIEKCKLSQFLNTGYDVYILDLGLFRTEISDEFYRCDKKLLLASAAPWRRDELKAFLLSYPNIRKFRFLFFMIQYGTKQDKTELAKTLSIPASRLLLLPFIRNPFRLEKEQFSFFKELL